MPGKKSRSTEGVLRRAKRPFRLRWLAARMVFAEARGRYAHALQLLGRLESETQLRLHEEALKALLLLRNDRPREAHDLFLSVRDRASEKQDPKSSYIRRYAQAWLANIRWDPFDAEREYREAEKIPCDPRLKRLLWLPTGEKPDRLRDEFDDWVKSNAPAADDLRKRTS